MHLPAAPAPAVAAAPAESASALPDVFDEQVFARLQQQKEKGQGEQARLPQGARLGGAIMVVNGIAQLSLRTIESSIAGFSAFVGPWTAAFDIVVGGVLLSGQGQVRRWAVIRLVLGGLCLPLFHLLRGQVYSALLQFLFSAGLLLMMVTRAGWLRITLGSAGACISTLLALTSMGPMLGFFNPLGHLTGWLNHEIAATPISALHGVRVPYAIDLSTGRWYVVNGSGEEDTGNAEDVSKNVVREFSPNVRRPDALLDVRLFAYQAPMAGRLDHDTLIPKLVESARDELPELLVMEDAWQSTAHGPMRVIEGQARIEEQRTGVALGFKGEGRCVFMIVGTAPPRMYARIRDDLLKVFASLSANGC
ncbi:MAG: hypothetical protein MUF51_08865 [Vicinamibacteria bacterium]|nr:hypothetical protein [Vicinamibacteria bacterium]